MENLYATAPGLGLVSSIAIPNLLDAFPMPPGETTETAKLLMEHSPLWAFFHGHAGFFPWVLKACLVWAACAMAALALHARALFLLSREGRKA
jgi:hypothetical protein